MKWSTNKITLTAVLASLTAVANIFSIQMTTSNYITFTLVPVTLASIYLGPVVGGSVGLIGDLIGCLIHPQGAINPLILLSSTLLGVLPYIIFTLLKNQNKTLKLIITIVITTLIVTSGLNTLALWLMYAQGSKSFMIYLLGRLPFQAINSAVNAIVLIVLINNKTIDNKLVSISQNNS